MITATMSPAEIIAEFEADRPHVMHAIKKSYGGKNRMNVAMQKGREACLRGRVGEMILDNVEPYNSGFTGNKWISYVYFRNNGFGRAVSGVRSFVYWYTDDDSIEACTLVTPFGRKALMLFTGHFFHRYAERENLGPVDIQLVTDFMLRKNQPLSKVEYKNNIDGRCRFDVILPDGIGRGYTSHFDLDTDAPYISHVKTYLPNRLLNKKQREETAEARERYARQFRPADTFVNAYIDDYSVEELQAICEAIFQPLYFRPNFGFSFYSILSRFFGFGNCFAISPAQQPPVPDGSPSGSDGIQLPPPFAFPPVLQHKAVKEDRAALLSIYHTYSQAIFEYLNYRNSNSYTPIDLVKIGLIANPAFPAAAAVVYFCARGLHKMSFSHEEIVHRLTPLFNHLSKPENKLTLQNVDHILGKYIKP